MQYFTLFVLTAVMSVPYIAERLKLLPVSAAFLPEVLGAITLLYIVVMGPRTRFRYVRAEYWLAFGGIAVIMICGIVANAVAPGPIFAGIRYYLRAIPLFFLPAVFLFTEKERLQQLRWLTIICVLQLPLAIRERLHVMDQGRVSGDSVIGSTEQSGSLSIILISAVCIITALTMRGHMSRKTFFALFVILLLPTTINETKATLILMPIGLLMTALIAAPPARRFRVVVLASALLMGFFAVFAPIYDYLERNNPYAVSITSFYTNPSNFMRYIGGNSDMGGTRVGRLDALKVPLDYLSREPARFAFGVGIGNASKSSMGEQFTGRYFLMFEKFLISSLTMFMLELGVLGAGLVFLLYWLIFRDSLLVARVDRTFMGGVAAGWSGVVAMTVVAMPYMSTHVLVSLSFLFWYMSGLIAARRMVLMQGPEYQHSRVDPPARAPVPAKTRAAAPLPAARSEASVRNRVGRF
jgi:hypothetical protein